MFHKLFHLPLFVLLLAGCNDDDDFTGSGNVISENRTVNDFTSINVGAVFEVTVRQASTPSVTVRADDNLQASIRTSAVNNVLNISLDRGSFENATLEVLVTMPDLTGIELNDAARMEVINFTVADRLTVVTDGATRLELSGSAPNLDLDLNGSSRLFAFPFSGLTCNAELNDASEGEVTVGNRLTGSVTDAAVLTYRGTPTVEVSTSEAGTVVNGN